MRACWRKLLLVAACALGTSGCESEPAVAPAAERLVLQAYLFAGEAIDDVQLTTSYGLNAGSIAADPVADATIELQKGGSRVQLTPIPEKPGFYYDANGRLDVDSGDRFTIRVSHTAWAEMTGETTIPPPPRDLQISSTELRIDAANRLDTSSVVVSWQNEPGALFYVVVENVEATLVPISTLPPGTTGGGRALRSQPMVGSRFVLRRMDFTYFGRHRVRVYRVNREYADLYLFGQQDTRSLTTPPSNLKNGLGIFAGFSSQEVSLVVTSTTNTE